MVVQNDYSIIDFEGEPLRSVEERRSKSSPLRDVAGMLRSFAYAAATAVRQMTDIQPAALATLQERAEEWRREVTGAFLSRYREVMAGAPSMPEDPAVADALVEFFTLEKALYEIDYELANRPAWVAIPLAGVLGLVPAESLSHADA
jgi:maltose alpha-D-glucosyltransferase/alpha-amylase